MKQVITVILISLFSIGIVLGQNVGLDDEGNPNNPPINSSFIRYAFMSFFYMPATLFKECSHGIGSHSYRNDVMPGMVLQTCIAHQCITSLVLAITLRVAFLTFGATWHLFTIHLLL